MFTLPTDRDHPTPEAHLGKTVQPRPVTISVSMTPGLLTNDAWLPNADHAYAMTDTYTATIN